MTPGDPPSEERGELGERTFSVTGWAELQDFVEHHGTPVTRAAVLCRTNQPALVPEQLSRHPSAPYIANKRRRRMWQIGSLQTVRNEQEQFVARAGPVF